MTDNNLVEFTIQSYNCTNVLDGLVADYYSERKGFALIDVVTDDVYLLKPLTIARKTDDALDIENHVLSLTDSSGNIKFKHDPTLKSMSTEAQLEHISKNSIVHDYYKLDNNLDCIRSVLSAGNIILADGVPGRTTTQLLTGFDDSLQVVNVKKNQNNNSNNATDNLTYDMVFSSKMNLYVIFDVFSTIH